MMEKSLLAGVTGGVGIISLMLFNKLGFEVTAITGKMNEKDLLTDLGANEVIDRNEFRFRFNFSFTKTYLFRRN